MLGIYCEGYDAEGAYPTIGVDRVRPFVDWLKKHNKRGLLGEYGVPGDDPRWLECLDLFLNYLAENGVEGTYWAAGARWNIYIYWGASRGELYQGPSAVGNPYQIHQHQMKIKVLTVCATLSALSFLSSFGAEQYDIVVLGGTPGGIMPAIEAHLFAGMEG